MVIESISVLAILICLFVVFIRAQRPDFAVSITPIMILPFAHLVALGILKAAVYLLPFSSYFVCLAFVDIAALAISSALLLLCSGKIKSKRNKRFYLIVLAGYNVILTCAYVYQTLQPMFA